MPSLSLAPKCGKAVALLEGGIRHDMPAIQPRSQCKPEGRERSKGNPQGGAAVVQLGVTYEEPSLPTSTGRQRRETRRKGVAHHKQFVATQQAASLRQCPKDKKIGCSIFEQPQSGLCLFTSQVFVNRVIHRFCG